MSLTGNLKDLGVGDIFQILFLSRRSGVLTIKGRAAEGKVCFLKGRIVTATSSRLSNSLADLLIDSGLAEESHMEKAIALIKEGSDKEALYSKLSKEIKIPENRIEEEIKKRLEEIVFSLFLEEGVFDFELKEAEAEFEDIKNNPLQITCDLPGLNPQFLAMEGTRLMDERKRGEYALTKEEASRPQVDDEAEPSITKEERQIIKPEKPSVDLTEGLLEDLGWTEEVPIVTTSPGLWLLKSMVYELQDPHTNPEITLLILRFASELMNRAVLLMVKKDHLSGLGQFGVSIEGKDANKVIRGIKMPLDEPSIFKEAIDQRVAVKKTLDDLKWNNYFINELGGERPLEVFAAPVMVNQKVAAVLYGDNLPETKEIGDTESLEIFLFQSGMAMERALLERRLKSSAAEQ